MEEKKLPPKMAEVLTTSHFAYLCSTNFENQPHITPMFFIFDEKTCKFYLMTSIDSKKMKNIHSNPKVCLTVDVRDAINPFNNRGVMVQGRAIVHFVLDTLSANVDQTLLHVYTNFERKYPVLKKAQSAVVKDYQKFSESLIKIIPNRMIYWKGPKFIKINFNNRE